MNSLSITYSVADQNFPQTKSVGMVFSSLYGAKASMEALFKQQSTIYLAGYVAVIAFEKVSNQ